jgi:hypothetical protein
MFYNIYISSLQSKETLSFYLQFCRTLRFQSFDAHHHHGVYFVYTITRPSLSNAGAFGLISAFL